MSDPAHVQYVEPQHHFSPSTSANAVFGWCLALPLFLVLLMRLLAEYRYRRAAQQDAQFDPDAQLREGPMVLKGAVSLDEDTPHAVQVTIRQQGTERKGKRSWTTYWKETGRDTDAHPFRLDTAQGLVRVEADAAVKVVRGLAHSTTRAVARDQRERIITLAGGDEIYASGELVYGVDTRAARGYRGGGGHALVMRGSARRPLLLSGEPLGERFKRAARTMRSWATAYLVVAVLMQLTFVTYHMRLLSGETTAAKVTRHSTYTTKSKSGTTTHFVLTMTMPDGRKVKDEVSHTDYRRIEDGQWVHVRYVTWMNGRERLGTGATVSTPHVILWTVLLAVMVVTQLLMARSDRPWYVAALKESSPGRLPES